MVVEEVRSGIMSDWRSFRNDWKVFEMSLAGNWGGTNAGNRGHGDNGRAIAWQI